MGTHFGFVPHFLKSKDLLVYIQLTLLKKQENLEELKNYMEDVRI